MSSPSAPIPAWLPPYSPWEVDFFPFSLAGRRPGAAVPQRRTGSMPHSRCRPGAAQPLRAPYFWRYQQPKASTASCRRRSARPHSTQVNAASHRRLRDRPRRCGNFLDDAAANDEDADATAFSTPGSRVLPSPMAALGAVLRLPDLCFFVGREMSRVFSSGSSRSSAAP